MVTRTRLNVTFICTLPVLWSNRSLHGFRGYPSTRFSLDEYPQGVPVDCIGITVLQTRLNEGLYLTYKNRISMDQCPSREANGSSVSQKTGRTLLK
jgi:hypothetical protein